MNNVIDIVERLIEKLENLEKANNKFEAQTENAKVIKLPGQKIKTQSPSQANPQQPADPASSIDYKAMHTMKFMNNLNQMMRRLKNVSSNVAKDQLNEKIKQPGRPKKDELTEKTDIIGNIDNIINKLSKAVDQPKYPVLVEDNVRSFSIQQIEKDNYQRQLTLLINEILNHKEEL